MTVWALNFYKPIRLVSWRIMHTTIWGGTKEGVTVAYIKANIANGESIMTGTMLVLDVVLDCLSLMLHSPLNSRTCELVGVKESHHKSIRRIIWFEVEYLAKMRCYQTISTHRIPLR